MGERRMGRTVLELAIGLLGLAFVFAGGAKLNDPAVVAGLFAAWGLGEWAIAPAAWVEVLLGLMLFHRPTRRAGAVGLVAWMLLFGLLQLRSGQAHAAAGSLAVLLLSLVALALTRDLPRPRRLVDLLPMPLRSPPRRPVSAAIRLVEIVGLSFLIRWAIGGVLFWSVLPVLGWAHADRSDGRERDPIEATLLYLLVLGLGVSGIWGFVGHRLMSDSVAAAIGWELGSPFQHELAFYHLGVGLAGLGCWWIRDRYWLAVGLIPSVFLYGAGLVHLQDFLATGNTSPGNWSLPILFGDLIVPTALLILLVLRRGQHQEPGEVSGGAPEMA
ncbi:MAG: DoxX family protein [Thermoanaerobaculia bacterium]|nr:DoxX family protein [Thermoanaerobaculia bacterium]